MARKILASNKQFGYAEHRTPALVQLVLWDLKRLGCVTCSDRSYPPREGTSGVLALVEDRFILVQQFHREVYVADLLSAFFKAVTRELQVSLQCRSVVVGSVR